MVVGADAAGGRHAPHCRCRLCREDRAIAAAARRQVRFDACAPPRRSASAAAQAAAKDREAESDYERVPTLAELGEQFRAPVLGPEITGRHPAANYSRPAWFRAAVFGGVIAVPLVVGAVLWLAVR